MYNVAARIRIYVKDQDALATIKKEVMKTAKVQHITDEEIGFGIKAIKAVLLLRDEEGGIDKIEEDIKKIPGVSEVEVENVTRI